MAEPTLSLTFADLKVAVAQFLGYSRTSGNWTTRQTANIEAAVKRGLRMFYYPQLVMGDRYQHGWRFLRPIRTLTAWPTTTTAAITVSGGSNTIMTAASGTPFYPSMIGKSIVAVTSGNSYTITGYTSPIIITVATNASADTGDTFTITADGDYRLPDDFQDFEGPVYFTDDDEWDELEFTGETKILQQRQYDATTGIPRLAAVTQVEYDSSNPTRYNLMVFPVPDGVYPLRYRSWISPDALGSDTDYPAGGTAHAETMYAAVLAGAELEVNQQPGSNYTLFRENLMASIARDRVANTPDTMGVMRDMGNYGSGDVISFHGSNESARVTYNGTLYGDS